MDLDLSLYTEKQKYWCQKYMHETTFEPLMTDFEHGNESFETAAKKSVNWFEDWASDAYLLITEDKMSRIAKGENDD